MATLFASNLVPACDTAARIQGWATFTENVLLGGGWVYVPQTGDTDPRTLTAATGGATRKGFRMYRMDDALQSSTPVFVRIDWGSMYNVGPWGPGLWIAIGKGADGAGNVTGVLLAPTGPGSALMSPGNASSTGTHNCYGSADTGRFCFGLFGNTGSAYGIVCGLERTKDALGQNTSDGLLFNHSSTSVTTATFRYSYYFGYTFTTQPSREDDLAYVLTQQNPSETFKPGDIGLGTIIPICGTAQQPGLNFLICNSLDVSPQGFIRTTLYGTVHTYQQLGNMAPVKTLTNINTVTATDTNARVLMRYD